MRQITRTRGPQLKFHAAFLTAFDPLAGIMLSEGLKTSGLSDSFLYSVKNGGEKQFFRAYWRRYIRFFLII